MAENVPFCTENFQKFSQNRGAHDARRRYYFYTPTFQMKVMALVCTQYQVKWGANETDTKAFTVGLKESISFLLDQTLATRQQTTVQRCDTCLCMRVCFDDELILATVRGLQFADIRRNSYHASSVLSLNIATKLMKVVANKSLSIMSLIEIELSKA